MLSALLARRARTAILGRTAARQEAIEWHPRAGRRGEVCVAQNDAVTHTGVLYAGEDNPVNLHLVEEVLGLRSNVRLLTAAEGGMGLELACAHKPDVILLDINLPGMNGLAVLKALQSRDETRISRLLPSDANAMPRDIEEDWYWVSTAT